MTTDSEPRASTDATAVDAIETASAPTQAKSNRTVRRKRSLWWWTAVLAAAFVGLVARTWNLDWDQRQHLHPDERHWSLVASAIGASEPTDGYPTVFGPVLTWLDGQRSPANPYRGDNSSFVYGPITLTATRAIAGWLHDGVVSGSQPAEAIVHGLDAAGLPLLNDDGTPRFDTAYQIDLIGRLIGALTDTLTVIVVALAARRVGGRWGRATGVAAAWLYACTVLTVQHAHYFGAEPALALTSALCVLAMLYVDRGESWRRATITGALAGASAGAVVAVKLSGLGLAVVPLLLLGGLAVVHRRRVDLIRLGAAALGGLVSFRVLCPPAFVGLGLRPNPIFMDDLRASRLASGSDFPPSIQWADRTFVFEATWWLLKFTLGPGLVLAGVAGLVLLWRAKPTHGLWVVSVVGAAVVVPYAFVFRDIVTSGRYFVPMVPALAIAAGYAVVRTLLWLQGQSVRAQRVGLGCVAALIVLVVLWPIAFLNGVHGQDHTRVRASNWIAANVEPGSTLTIESWDDGLPLAVEGAEPSLYESIQLDLFDVDSVAKIARVAGQLPEADYIVESSPRVWDSVVRIPARYPSTIQLFEALDDGTLGFERVATFSSPPTLGPLRLEHGEEAFSVYDHPEVRIWRNVEHLDSRTIFDRLDPVAAASAMRVHPRDAAANGGMATAAELAANDSRGSFDDELAESGWLANHVVQLAAWLLILALLSIATWVIMQPVLLRLPDAGAGLAPTLAIVVVVAGSVVASGWLRLPYGRGLLLALTSGWVLAAGLIGWRRRGVLRELGRTRRRTLTWAVAVNVMAFAVGAAVRAANPDLWHPYRGGEKPFEMAMLTSVLRSRSIPPPDAWFAGGALNYHYGGSMMVAVPARLAGTVPEVALNLGLAMVAMLAAGAAYSLGAVLATMRRDAIVNDASGWRRHHTQSMARRGGLLAAGFVLVVPNMAIVPSVTRRLIGDESGTLDWWALSRVVPGSPIVTEFPAWSILFGDLHGHLIGLPIVLTSTTLVVLALQTSSRLAFLATMFVAGVVVGMSRAVNSWDFPLTLGSLIVVLVLVAVTSSWRRAVVGALAAAIGCVVVWMPYTSRVEVGTAGFDLNHDPTRFASFLAQWGLWIAMSVLVVVVYGKRLTDRTTPRSRLSRGAVAGLAAAMLVALVLSIAFDRGATLVAAVLGAACAATAVLAWRRSSEAIPPAAFGALAAGWLVVAAVECIVFTDDLARMNTVFKWWFHAWALIAVGCAASVAGLLPRWRHVTTTGRAGRSAIAAVAAAGLVAAAFMVLAVPARLDDRISTSGASLDGLDWLDAQLELSRGDSAALTPGDDRAMIEWMRANVTGMPTMLEAPGEQYDWIGRVSGLTGLPTVLGWPYHLSQQRPSAGAAISERSSDAVAFYRALDPDVALDVLWRRDVDLVVFGSSERVLAGDEGADRIRQLPCLDVVFDDQRSFVATVDHACLDPRAATWSFDHGGQVAEVVVVG